MCGIAGSSNLIVDVETALKGLSHRGPDDLQHVEIDAVQLIHARLAVIDAEGGAQPMCRGALTACYNGEIYNHLELRKQFNLACTSGSDTETILCLYERLGTECFAHLDGMFALALYDGQSQQLTLVRDRAGEKPLYIYQQGQAMVFASELNVLASLVSLDKDDASVNHYLSTGFQYQQQTPYKNVNELRPGHYLTVSAEGKVSEQKSWFELDVTASATNKPSQSDALRQLDDLLDTAVKNRLLSSDLEVGCFLSGGIDSGLVTAMASRHVDQLKTFTVTFDGQFNEAPLASKVAERYQTDHRELNISFSDLAQDIENILGAFGEPICDDSVIPAWYVSKAAKEHVTVVLTGDGADELFGGYRRYVPYAHLDLFNEKNALVHKVIGSLAKLPPPSNKMSRYNYIYRLAEMLSLSGLERFLAAMVNVSTTGLLHKEFAPELVEGFKSLAKTPATSLSKVMAMDFNSLLPGSVLPKMDIASMAHALETRTPFFSSEIIQLASALPDNLIIRGNTTKYLLRELAKHHLPEELVNAPKRGFETPLVEWIDGTLKEPIFDRLGGNTYVSQFYEPGTIPRLLAGESSLSRLQRARTIWMLYATEIWAAKSSQIRG